MKRTYGTLVLLIAAIAILGVYFLVDPSSAIWMPKCPIKMMTGLDCPGCGSQRMVHALMHGDIVEAWHQNALLLCCLPVLGYMVWLELTYKKHPERYRRFYGPLTTWIAAILIIAWFLFRNFVL